MNHECRALQLPLVHPDIDVNSYHAFSLAILQTNEEKALTYLLSNYIHLFGTPEGNDGDFMHFTNASQFHELPCCYVSRLHTDQLRDWFPDPLDLFVDCLRRGHYLAIALDEYFIPGMAAYRHRHYVHHMLIHGFDLDEQLFYVAGYFGDPPAFSFGRPVSFAELREAVAHIKPVKERISQTLDIIQYPYQGRSTPAPELDTAYIAKSLEEHLNSTALTERNPKRAQCWFGLRAYDLLIQFLLQEQECDRPTVDMKALQTLVNHKKLMVRRVEYMVAHSVMEENGLIGMAKELLRKTVALHHQCLKQRLHPNPRNLDKAVQYVQGIKAYEQDFLERWLAALNLQGASGPGSLRTKY